MSEDYDMVMALHLKEIGDVCVFLLSYFFFMCIRFGSNQFIVLYWYIYVMQGPPAEGETADQPHSNRFNAVIEKIERLYMVLFPISLTIWSNV